MNTHHDIDREREMHEHENRQPTTFAEMVAYMRSKPNCRVNGKGYHIKDLHRYLELIEQTVNATPAEKRTKNIVCKTIKTRLAIVIDDYNAGSIEPVGTVHEKPPFGIYGG